MPGDAALREPRAVEEVAAHTRQRPEDILAQTLSAPARPETPEGWSSKGRRIFLLCMAVAGVVLVVAGLLVTKELAPGPGTPAPLETGPGNGLAGQLLQSTADEPPQEPSANVPLPLPLQPAPASRSTRTEPSAQAPATPNALSTGAGTEPGTATGRPTPTTAPPTTAPPTTIPCTGLLGQTLQQSQLLPCRAAGGSLGSRSG